jgi:hypothetical protein
VSNTEQPKKKMTTSSDTRNTKVYKPATGHHKATAASKASKPVINKASKPVINKAHKIPPTKSPPKKK